MAQSASSRFFPPADEAGPEGLVALGGQLEPEWLLDAYRHGIFPWPVLEEEMPLAWWSPDPRAILELDALHISRRLRRTLRSGAFRVTCDHDFRGVIEGCAIAGERADEGTWITPEMKAAYTRLHDLGHAHSIEVRHRDAPDRLVGGIYGVAIGGLFAGESMFHHVRDASKIALVHLVAHLQARGYRLFDIQQLTEHMQTMGATELPRAEYLARLADAVEQPVEFGIMLERDARPHAADEIQTAEFNRPPSPPGRGPG